MMVGEPFEWDLCTDDFREQCREKMIKVLAKAEVRGEITMIESVFIKEAFDFGYKDAGKLTMSKREQID